MCCTCMIDKVEGTTPPRVQQRTKWYLHHPIGVVRYTVSLTFVSSSLSPVLDAELLRTHIFASEFLLILHPL